MSSIQDSFYSYLTRLDKNLLLGISTGKTLAEWMKPFVNSLTEDGAVSYLLNKNERYRASPLASSLIWLDNAGLIPLDLLELMQNKLLLLRDQNHETDNEEGNKSKKTEDKMGWSLAEGVSVWSTSLSIIALMDSYDIGIKRSICYKESIIWLVQQQNINTHGWAYQLSENCNVNVPMTSLALQALARIYQKREDFHFSQDEDRLILNALSSGFHYLKESCVFKKGKSYWCFQNKPHCASTTWSLLAISELCKISSLSNDIPKFYSKIKQSCFSFILSMMPSRINYWEEEQLVCEAGAKYNKQKNYYSFTATLIPQLFSLGLSPYNPKVIKQIRWLIDNPTLWKLKPYNQGNICAFTYAMIISTIVSWHSLVGQTLSKNLLYSPDSLQSKFFCFITGYSYFKHEPMQIVSKKLLNILIYTTILLILLLLFHPSIISIINYPISFIMLQWDKISNSVGVEIIATAIISCLLLIGRFLLRFLRRKK